MSYEPTTWKTGDVVTADKLNKMESGISDAEGGSGGTFIVHALLDSDSQKAYLDKTWQEVHDAIVNGEIVLVQTGAEVWTIIKNLYPDPAIQFDADFVVLPVNCDMYDGNPESPFHYGVIILTGVYFASETADGRLELVSE